MAGEDWACRFLKRNPTLSVRKPEGTSIFRAAGFNREKVNRFYDVMESVVFPDGIQTVPDGNIFYVDESGYTICHRPQNCHQTSTMRHGCRHEPFFVHATNWSTP